MAAIRRWRNTPYFRRIWGFGGLYKRKAPKAPPFCARLGGGGLPDGEVAPQGPEGALAICLPAPSGGFGGVPPPGIFRHPAGGVVGSRPDRRVTFLRGQESNQRNRRGPLPAPWTPGAVVPDLRPLLAFSLEPSSGLSAAWVDTRRPPPFGCWNWEGMRFVGSSPTEGGSWRRRPLRPKGDGMTVWGKFFCGRG